MQASLTTEVVDHQVIASPRRAPHQGPAKELMQPLQQTGPLVALRFVLLGDPDEASLLAQELDMGTQKHSDIVGMRYSGGGLNWIASPPSGTHRRFWASES